MGDHALVAQWIEHLATNQGVGGSSPLWCNYDRLDIS